VNRFGRSLLFVIAATIAFAGLLVLARTLQAQPSTQNAAGVREAFEVISIKPGNLAATGGGGARGGTSLAECTGGSLRIEPARFTINKVTVYTLVTWAYGMGRCLNVSLFELLDGGPAWVKSEGFAIQALMPAGSPSYTADQLRNGQAPKLALMIQNMLADRFKLAVHKETREVPIYALTVAKSGPKLHKVEEGSCLPRPVIDGSQPLPKPPGPDEKPWCGMGGIGVNPSLKATADVRSMSLDEFSLLLGPILDRPVINKTGITGMVAFHLEFGADQSASKLLTMLPPPPPGGGGGPVGAPPASEPSGPSIFSAIQEQVGLRLEPTKGPAEVVIIDRVERPSEN